MTEADVNKYRAVLTAKREEIMGALPRREDIWIVQSNEQIEMVQLAGQREFAACVLEREAKSLLQISAALKRIDDGEFGVCLDCEEPISPKRLSAVPWAGYCLHCQEIHDAQEATDTTEPRLAAFKGARHGRQQLSLSVASPLLDLLNEFVPTPPSCCHN